jgi:hypothetical protein
MSFYGFAGYPFYRYHFSGVFIRNLYSIHNISFNEDKIVFWLGGHICTYNKLNGEVK